MSQDVDRLYRLVGQRIAAARGRMSQTRLAQLVGLSRGSIANIELGRQRAPLHTIWAIATVLKHDPRAFLPDPDHLISDDQDTAAVSKRLARVAGASLPKVQRFIATKKAEERGNGEV